MLHVRMDTKQLNTMLENTASYTLGFLEGAEVEQIDFNRDLGDFTVEALYKYIDSSARTNPQVLHHVYEWGQVGSPSGRLFVLRAKTSKRVIHIYGRFLPSRSMTERMTVPFKNKAQVMEDGISVTITPKNSDVLAFEHNGDMVFTRNSIYVEHPGGPEVENSFGRTVDEFFDGYFSNGLLKPLVDKMANAKEYTDNFRQGTVSGRSAGVRAGRKYMSMPLGVEDV